MVIFFTGFLGLLLKQSVIDSYCSAQLIIGVCEAAETDEQS
jgi:hypothetical protein